MYTCIYIYIYICIYHDYETTLKSSLHLKGKQQGILHIFGVYSCDNVTIFLFLVAISKLFLRHCKLLTSYAKESQGVLIPVIEKRM